MYNLTNKIGSAADISNKLMEKTCMFQIMKPVGKWCEQNQIVKIEINFKVGSAAGGWVLSFIWWWVRTTPPRRTPTYHSHTHHCPYVDWGLERSRRGDCWWVILKDMVSHQLVTSEKGGFEKWIILKWLVFAGFRWEECWSFQNFLLLLHLSGKLTESEPRAWPGK